MFGLAASAVAACTLAVSTEGLNDPFASSAEGSTGDSNSARPSGDGSADVRDDDDARAVEPGSRESGVPFESCAAIRLADPSAPTGAYAIQPPGRATVDVECEMDRSGGGWTQVIDFEGATDPCPSKWAYDSVAKGCRRSGDGIDGAFFDVPLTSYREVLISATGSQRFSTDGFTGKSDVDQSYVDGVSITTRIDGQRAHIFTFATGLTAAAGVEPANQCPCNDGGTQPPSFVGTSFLCDTASPTEYPPTEWLSEALWGGNARGLGTCAAGVAPRFVTSTLGQPSTQPIEVRIMADQDRANEDVAIRTLRLYVR